MKNNSIIKEGTNNWLKYKSSKSVDGHEFTDEKDSFCFFCYASPSESFQGEVLIFTWYKEFKACKEDSWDIIPVECWRSKLLSQGRAHAKIAPLEQKHIT